MAAKTRLDPFRISDGPGLTEGHWYSLAIASALLTAVAIVFAFVWIFGDGFDPDGDLKAAQALAPFGVALFALVTFCTVGWRGTISARQANQAEREGRAKLLQEGAKLLGEKHNPSHVSAGVATLEILITGPDEKLAVQAMNLIADYIQSEMGESHIHRFKDETFAALAAGADLGREANRTIKFAAPIVEREEGVEWTDIRGVKVVQYAGGKIEGALWGSFVDRPNYRYSGVRLFLQENVVIDHRYSKCVLVFSDIVGYRGNYGPDNQFKECDFSGCKFRKTARIPDLKEGLNYFRPGREPTWGNDGPIRWESYLLVKPKGEMVAVDMS